MPEYSKEALERALDGFLQEDYDLADECGYEISTYVSDDGSKIQIDVELEDQSMVDIMPKISVYSRRQGDGSWEFPVDVEFPVLNLETLSGNASDILNLWKGPLALADDLASVKFVLSEWI